MYQTALRGVLALVVLAHHMSLFVPMGGIGAILRECGKPAVAAFLFLSGQGLMRQMRQRQGYLNGFFGRQMKKLWLPYSVMATCSFLAWPLTHGHGFGWADLCDRFRYGDPIVSNGWYVFFLAALYGVFFLSARILRRPWWIVSVAAVVTLAWIPVCQWVGWGAYWYASGPAFALGLAWGAWGKPSREGRSRCPFLTYVGKIGYELYLVHGWVLLLLRKYAEGAMLGVAVLVLSVAAAAGLHHIIRKTDVKKGSCISSMRSRRRTKVR